MSDLCKDLVFNALNDLRYHKHKVQRFYEQFIQDINNDIKDLELSINKLELSDPPF